MTPLRKRHHTDTVVGEGSAIGSDCILYDYYQYWFTSEERVESHKKEIGNILLRVFSFGAVGVEDTYYYRIIKHERWWSENTCEPGVHIDEREDSHVVKIVEESNTAHTKTYYREYPQDDDYWEKSGGGITIFGKSTDWWKEHTVVGDVPITIVDTSAGPTEVQPIDYSGLRPDDGDNHEFKGDTGTRDMGVSPDAPEGIDITAPGISTKDATYPQNVDKPGIEFVKVPKTGQTVVTGAQLKEMFPRNNFADAELEILDDQDYSIKFIQFNNPRNNPDYRFSNSETVIQGTYGEVRYLITKVH